MVFGLCQDDTDSEQEENEEKAAITVREKRIVSIKTMLRYQAGIMSTTSEEFGKQKALIDDLGKHTEYFKDLHALNTTQDFPDGKADYLRFLQEKWHQLDLEEIDEYLSLPNPWPQKIMSSLLLQITDPMLLRYRRYQYLPWYEVWVTRGGYHPSSIQQDLQYVQKLAPVVSTRPMIYGRTLSAFLCERRVKHPTMILWTSVDLFDAGLPGGSRWKYIKFFKVLTDARRRSKESQFAIFSTPLGRCVARYNWSLVQPLAFIECMAELVTGVLLACAAHETHHQRVPGLVVVAILVLLEAITLFYRGVEMVMSVVIFRKPPIFGAWSLLSLTLEVFVMVFFATALARLRPYHEGSVYQVHPIFFACTILAKWMQVALHTMSVNFIGTTVLPVWQAAMSAASLTFLAFLLIGVLMCGHAYYSLPLDDVTSFTEAFVRIYRLLVGDFDLGELAGTASVLTNYNETGKATPSGVFAEVGDGPIVHFRHQLDQMMMMFVFLGTTVFLNIYVGVVSDEYNNVVEHVDTIHSQFQAAYTMRLMLRREALISILGILSSNTHMSDSDSDEMEIAGHWICMTLENKEALIDDCSGRRLDHS